MNENTFVSKTTNTPLYTFLFHIMECIMIKKEVLYGTTNQKIDGSYDERQNVC